MNTYNNFNELAAGQTVLHSDMSVFNKEDVPVAPDPTDIAYALKWNVRALTKYAMDMLEDANAHGAVYLLDMYMKKGFPNSDDVKAKVTWA